MKYLYTYPPKGRIYPYIMRHLDNERVPCGHEILDIRIYDFVKSGDRYPKQKIRKWKDARPKGWKVVPDYPDITGEFGTCVDFCNIEYSKELMLKHYRPEYKTHLPVMQSKYNDPDSFKDYCKWFLKEFPMPDKIAIGSLCQQYKFSQIQPILETAKLMFPDSHIHVFGLGKRAAKKFNHLFDSWDTTAWTFGDNGSAKTEYERRKYFDNYLDSLKELIGVYYGSN